MEVYKDDRTNSKTACDSSEATYSRIYRPPTRKKCNVKTNETTQTNFYSRSSDGAGAILCLSERMEEMKIKRIPPNSTKNFCRKNLINAATIMELKNLSWTLIKLPVVVRTLTLANGYLKPPINNYHSNELSQ
jgi:hypothetical protein